jgi:hypothetical protein
MKLVGDISSHLIQWQSQNRRNLEIAEGAEVCQQVTRGHNFVGPSHTEDSTLVTGVANTPLTVVIDAYFLTIEVEAWITANGIHMSDTLRVEEHNLRRQSVMVRVWIAQTHGMNLAKGQDGDESWKGDRQRDVHDPQSTIAVVREVRVLLSKRLSIYVTLITRDRKRICQ